MLIREDYRNNKCRKLIPYEPTPAPTPEPTPHTPRKPRLLKGTPSGGDLNISDNGPSWSPNTSRCLESSIVQMARAVGRNANRTEMALTMMSSSMSDQQDRLRKMHLSINRLCPDNQRPCIPPTDLDSESGSNPNWAPTQANPKYQSTQIRDTSLAEMIREQSELLDAGGYSRSPSLPISGSTSAAMLEMKGHAGLKIQSTWQ